MTISAKVIADSVSDHSPRLTTLQLRYPKFIHGEFMTHRVFSRNASSSRAIPVDRLIRDVVNDPVYPLHWGKNRPGMSAMEECNEIVAVRSAPPLRSMDRLSREEAWDSARDVAVEMAKAFSASGYHKQIVNRLLEPFCHINVVVTSTEWSNFFALRDHDSAQPEIRVLAREIKLAMLNSSPIHLRPGQWHLPYVTNKEMTEQDHSDHEVPFHVKLSVARCARVSYLTQDGKAPSVEDDLKLYDRLVGSVPLHASPAEHQATPDKKEEDYYGAQFRDWANPELHGNLRGWIQHRKTLKGESQ